MKKAILFDLDGTLWDAAGGVAKAWNEVMKENGRPATKTAEDIHHYMGWPMDAIADELFSDLERKEDRLALLESCTRLENAILARDGGQLYPNVEEVLSRLKEDYFLGIVSNCQCGYIEAFLQAHKLHHLFDDWICWGDTQREKSFSIRQLMKRNNLEEAVYVGDIEKDQKAAQEAGIPFILAAYGFGPFEWEDSISSFEQLPSLLKQKEW